MGVRNWILGKGGFSRRVFQFAFRESFVSILIMRDNEMGKIMTSLVPCKIIVHCFCIFDRKSYICSRKDVSGCSSARLEYTSGGRVVAGSNPVIPTKGISENGYAFICHYTGEKRTLYVLSFENRFLVACL